MNKCKEAGCNKPVHVELRGLCRSHYFTWCQHNKPNGKKPCTVEHCSGHVYAKSVCRLHYGRMRRFGSYELPVKPLRFCECGEEVFSRDKCKKCYSSWYYNTQLGRSDGQHWHKDVVTYMGAHGRIKAVRGLARHYDCELCHGPAKEWALSAETPVERLFFGGQHDRDTKSAYSMDPNDYFPACGPCHRKYDAETGNRAYKHGENSRAGKSRWTA